MSVEYKLEPFDIRELKTKPKRKYSKGYTKRDVIGAIEYFIDSGHDCCRLCVCDSYRKAFSEITTLNKTIKSHNYDNVKAVIRGEEIYLVKKSKWEEKEE